MTTPSSWVQIELSRHFPQADWNQGVDLNQNGTLEENEQIQDFDGNGSVGDPSDWFQFLNKNQPKLRSLSPFFDGFFRWGQGFRPDNPIHELLAIEAEISTPEAVQRAYQKIAEILAEVKKRVAAESLTEQQKVALVYEVMESKGIRFGERGDSTYFIEHLEQDNLDCDSSSFVTLIVGHEMREQNPKGWPLHLVLLSNHAFVRWDDPQGIRFNTDYGKTHTNDGEEFTDEHWTQAWNLALQSVENGVYLKSLNRKQLRAFFIANRGQIKSSHGQYKAAIRDYQEALTLDPSLVQAYINMSNAKSHIGLHQEAWTHARKAVLELDPHHPFAYLALGAVKDKLGKHQEALEYFNQALKYLSYHTRTAPSEAASIYTAICSAKKSLSRYEEAMKDCRHALKLDPTNGDTYSKLGGIQSDLGQLEAAQVSFEKAIQLDPYHAEAHSNLGWVNFGLGRREEAFNNCNRALEIHPNQYNAYNVRGVLYLSLGKFALAYSDFKMADQLGHPLAAANLWLARLVPDHIDLTLQAHLGLQDEIPDWGPALNTSWRFFELAPQTFLGPRFHLNYANPNEYHLMGLAGGIALLHRPGPFALETWITAGHRLTLNSDALQTDIEQDLYQGTFLNSGTGVSFPIMDPLRLGGSLAWEYYLDPAKLALVPGLSLAVSPW